MTVTRPRRRTLLALVVVLATLGVTPAPARAEPAAVGATEGATNDWRSVSTGPSHTCAIRTDRRLYCWGDNNFGQLGINAITGDRTSPQAVVTTFTDWVQVSVGQFFTCARRAVGRLYCWGWNQDGRLGAGLMTMTETTPVQVSGNRTDWRSVDLGAAHACARRATGRIYCWGDDAFAQLGNPASSDAAAPVAVGAATDWTSVSAGDQHTCGRRATGRAYCWGDNLQGQLGDANLPVDASTPVPVSGNRTDWVQVVAGGAHSCARRADRRLFCWGGDGVGQLGNGAPSVASDVPVQVSGNRTDWVAVSAGNGHSCARRADRRLFCWGSDGDGNLGDDLNKASKPSPVEVAGGATDWASVVAGGASTCARTTGNRLFCWGNNGDGQVADGTTDDRPLPTPVLG